MALNWSPHPRSDEQPVLLRPVPPRAQTVFQAAPHFARIDPPTPRALARRLAKAAAAAPATRRPRRGALDDYNGAGLREAPLHARRRSVPVRRYAAETPPADGEPVAPAPAPAPVPTPSSVPPADDDDSSADGVRQAPAPAVPPAAAAPAPALMPPPAPLADPGDVAPGAMPPPPPIEMQPAPPLEPPDDDDDDRSVASASSAALGIESRATSFSARDDLPAAPPPFEPPDDAQPFEPPDDAPPLEPPDDDDDDDETAPYDHGGDPFLDGDGTIDYEGDGGDDALTTTMSRFWGVTWNRERKKWLAYWRNAAGKKRYVGLFDDEEEAARAVNKAIRDAGLEGRRKTNPVDATGALVPRETYTRRKLDRAAVVAPDAARDKTATTSKFWGVGWHKSARRWAAAYHDANGKTRHLGLFDTQEQAAHAVNAAIRRAGLEGRRRTNPVVDGRLVPRARNANGHGEKSLRKRRHEESGAAPAAPPRARPRRAVNYADSEPEDEDDEDEDEDEDLEIEPDDDDGWD